MKKLRVFQTVKSKRIVTGLSIRSLGTVLLLLFLIPYLFTFFFGNFQSSMENIEKECMKEQLSGSHVYVYNETGVGTERIPLEIYVADKLSRSIDGNYEMEALKAQAVLVRSGILSRKKGQEGSRDIYLADEDYGSGTVSEKFLQATAQTGGIYLAYDGSPVNGAYFAVSNGATRDGGELKLLEYPYLKTVLCEKDFLSPDYADRISFYDQEFERIWEECIKDPVTEEELLIDERIRKETEGADTVLYRDRAGYVLYAKREGEFVSGEQMRLAYMLPSASFHIEEEEKIISFSVRGRGHGMGMSQFAANEMAKEGKNFTEILNYFFEEATISKFE